VPEAFRERIFEPFFRLPGHAEKAGGVGLGLALVRQIAERHGGAVRCEPREGGGSCFTLPAACSPPEAAARPLLRAHARATPPPAAAAAASASPAVLAAQ
jgi:K+-sensing histidine kinase KdpD